MTDRPDNRHTQRRKLPHDAFTECWYVPGETHIVDLIHPDDGLTLHYSDNADAIRSRYPGAVRISFEDAWKLAEAAGNARYKQDVNEIDEAQFMDALSVLPPVGWTTKAGVESFRISERLWGNLTDIYARLGDRTFKLVDDIRLPAATIAERVAAYAAAHPRIEPSTSDDGPRRTAESDRRLHQGNATPPAPEPGDAL